jgi:hypothetical protein
MLPRWGLWGIHKHFVLPKYRHAVPQKKPQRGDNLVEIKKNKKAESPIGATIW